MAGEKLPENIAKAAAEVGAEKALEFYVKEKQKEKKARIDRRLRDTKRLMRSYREIKIHAGDAIATLKEAASEDFDFFRDLMETTDEIDVKAIVRSKARSAIILRHIDTMLAVYEEICFSSKRPEDERRYRVLEAMCLAGDSLPVKDIASQENIDYSTVYRDFDAACEKMSALLFGIQWLDRE